MCIATNQDLRLVYKRLEQIRITLEHLEGVSKPEPMRITGRTPNLFGRRFEPEPTQEVLDRIADETGVHIKLYLFPYFSRPVTINKQYIGEFKRVLESVRIQIERLLVLDKKIEANNRKSESLASTEKNRTKGATLITEKVVALVS